MLLHLTKRNRLAHYPQTTIAYSSVQLRRIVSSIIFMAQTGVHWRFLSRTIGLFGSNKSKQERDDLLWIRCRNTFLWCSYLCATEPIKNPSRAKGAGWKSVSHRLFT